MTARRAAVVWIVGLVTAVPWATWYLFFEAPRESYALLITGILFWIFGYWSLVGPLLMAIRLRSVMRALENARSASEAMTTLRSPETREVAIDLFARETRLPRFVARRVVDHVLRRIVERAAAPTVASAEAGSALPPEAS